MEERKSVLETTKPADALGRLASRQSPKRSIIVLLVVVAVVVVVALIALILQNTIRGSENVRAPAVLS